MADRTTRPPTPARLCMTLEARRLVALGVLDGGVGTAANALEFRDAKRPSRVLKITFRVVKSGGTAVLTLGGADVVCRSWAMKSGRRFWQFACPECGRAARKLWAPKDRPAEWACRFCHRIIPDSRQRALDRAAERAAMTPHEREAADWVDEQVAARCRARGIPYNPEMFR